MQPRLRRLFTFCRSQLRKPDIQRCMVGASDIKEPYLMLETAYCGSLYFVRGLRVYGSPSCAEYSERVSMIRVSRDILVSMDSGDFVIKSSHTGQVLVRLDDTYPDIIVNGVKLDFILLSGVRSLSEVT